MQGEQPPDWALRRAEEELYDVDDAEAVTRRAREIAHEQRQLVRESHDEYDDPDRGGEG